jgi:hypothetical protein
VHTDNDYIIMISVFDLPQLRENVDAVYSAICPEIEQYYLAPQTRERGSLGTGVNPIQA